MIVQYTMKYQPQPNENNNGDEKNTIQLQLLNSSEEKKEKNLPHIKHIGYTSSEEEKKTQQHRIEKNRNGIGFVYFIKMMWNKCGIKVASKYEKNGNEHENIL